MQQVPSPSYSWKWLFGTSQIRFVKGISCLTNLIFFCNEMSGGVDKGGTMYVVYHTFSSAFGMVSHVAQLVRHGFDQWMKKWMETGWTVILKRLWAVRHTYGWLLVASPRGGYWYQCCMMASLTTWMMRQRCTHCKLVIATKLGDAFDVLEGRAAVQRDTDRLEKWAGQQFQHRQVPDLVSGLGSPCAATSSGPMAEKIALKKST